VEVVEPIQRRARHDPIIDYSKSIIMTSEEYLRAMEEKARLRGEAEKDRELKRRKSELMKKKKIEEEEASKLQRQKKVVARKTFKERWSTAGCARAGDDLHRRIKSSAPPPPGSYVGKFLTLAPPPLSAGPGHCGLGTVREASWASP
jgi:hypothetical protein